MDEIQKKHVLETVEQEGFDYAFISYSNFEEIESKDFHEARKEFLNAREKLATIIGYTEE